MMNNEAISQHDLREVALPMQSAAGLQCRYLTSKQFLACQEQCVRSPLAQLAPAPAPQLLGAVCFADDSSGNGLTSKTGGHDVPVARLAMPCLNKAGHRTDMYEAWFADAAVTYGMHGRVRFGRTDTLLWGMIQIEESHMEDGGSANAKTPLQRASEEAYVALFECLDDLGFPALLRTWNYIADINAESFGVERYQQFNTGRQDGFRSHGRAVTGSVPAASAVGIQCGPEHSPLTVCFIASKHNRAIAIENPRQVSAYQYPVQYGITSPTFSRASVVPLGDQTVLFISGTASIVGHETLHIGDVAAQARETLANIAAVLNEANRLQPSLSATVPKLLFRIYIRHASDICALDAALREQIGSDVELLYLQADICRAALLMEIEAMTSTSTSTGVSDIWPA